MSSVDTVNALRGRMKSKTTRKISKETIMLGFKTVSLKNSAFELRLEDVLLSGEREKIHRVFIATASDYKIGWILNRFCKKCMRCDAVFGFTRRKHHCRVCGDIVCNKCSRSKVMIDSLNERNGSRACDSCKISWPPSSKSGWLR